MNSIFLATSNQTILTFILPSRLKLVFVDMSMKFRNASTVKRSDSRELSARIDENTMTEEKQRKWIVSG